MATSSLFRALRRRELAAPLGLLSCISKASGTISPLAYKLTRLARPFSSKPSGNGGIEIDLGTTNSCVSVMEGKGHHLLQMEIEKFQDTIEKMHNERKYYMEKMQNDRYYMEKMQNDRIEKMRNEIKQCYRDAEMRNELKQCYLDAAKIQTTTSRSRSSDFDVATEFLRSIQEVKAQFVAARYGMMKFCIGYTIVTLSGVAVICVQLM